MASSRPSSATPSMDSTIDLEDEDMETEELGLHDYRISVNDIPHWSKCVGLISRCGYTGVTCWIVGFQNKYIYLLTCKSSITNLKEDLQANEEISVEFDDFETTQSKKTQFSIALRDSISNDFLDYELLREEVPVKVRKSMKRYIGLGMLVECLKPRERDILTLIGHSDSQENEDNENAGEKCMDFCQVIDMEDEFEYAFLEGQMEEDMYFRFSKTLVLVQNSSYKRAAGSPCFANGGKLVSMHTGTIDMYADLNVLIYKCVQHMKKWIEDARKESLHSANEWTIDTIDSLFPRLRSLPPDDAYKPGMCSIPSQPERDITHHPLYKQLDRALRNILQESKSKIDVVAELKPFGKNALHEFRKIVMELVKYKVSHTEDINLEGLRLVDRQCQSALSEDIYELFFFVIGVKSDLPMDIFQQKQSKSRPGTALSDRGSLSSKAVSSDRCDSAITMGSLSSASARNSSTFQLTDREDSFLTSESESQPGEMATVLAETKMELSIVREQLDYKTKLLDETMKSMKEEVTSQVQGLQGEIANMKLQDMYAHIPHPPKDKSMRAPPGFLVEGRQMSSPENRASKVFKDGLELIQYSQQATSSPEDSPVKQARECGHREGWTDDKPLPPGYVPNYRAGQKKRAKRKKLTDILNSAPETMHKPLQLPPIVSGSKIGQPRDMSYVSSKSLKVGSVTSIDSKCDNVADQLGQFKSCDIGITFGDVIPPGPGMKMGTREYEEEMSLKNSKGSGKIGH